MLILPAIGDTDPIRCRRPSHRQGLFSNIPGEAMRLAEPVELQFQRRHLAAQRRPRPMAPEEGPGVVAGGALDRGRGEGRHGPGQ
jgi:hypothetical protein